MEVHYRRFPLYNFSILGKDKNVAFMENSIATTLGRLW
jgi:hypothetical protein